MKKLLIFMLVLGLASTAGATISLQVDSSSATSIEIDNTVVSNVQVQVYSDDSASWLGYCIIEEGGAGALSNGASTSNAGDNAYITAYTETGWGAGYEMQSDWLSVQTQAGLQHTMDIDVSGLSLGDSGVISLWDDRVGYDEGDEQGRISFTIIPEPATIALLGLGGLLLRRRK